MPTEAYTCRKLAVPALPAVGWDNKPHANPCDLLCHLAFTAPAIACRQRADRVGFVMVNRTNGAHSCSTKRRLVKLSQFKHRLDYER
jgi:hypothetical protein